ESYTVFQGQQEMIDLDRILESKAYQFSNYFTLKIPRGPNWPMGRLRNYLDDFIHLKFHNLYQYGPELFVHLDTGISRTIIDPLMHSEVIEMVLSDQLKIAKHDKQKNVITGVTMNECWITDNPGQQLLSGSFEPLKSSWDEWLGFSIK
ncbi:hypothetical protein HDV02_005935, partial [Globomyces sp. JEL0801]